MDFLLRIPIWLGLLIVIITTTIPGLIVVIQAKKYLINKITRQHEKVGRIMFRVTAGLIALLISLSYANERMNQKKIIDSLENEASLIVNITLGLNLYDIKETNVIEKKIIDYVNYTIDDHWENISKNPYFSDATEILREINALIYDLPVASKNHEIIKLNLIKEINEVNKLMQIRIYSRYATTPYLVYILFLGLLFMWIFFTVYKLDFIALLFLSLYNILISVLIYFVFMLSNPLVGPLKIEADSFSIIKTKGIDMKYK